MARESLVGFPKKVQKALLDGDYQYALRLFQDPKYQAQIITGSWDLIPLITEHLTDPVAEQNPEFFKACVQMLEVIAVQSNVEEVVLQLVSEIEETKNDTRFMVLLDCLPDVIQRITKNKAASLSWIFNALLVYIIRSYKGSVVNYFNLDADECVILDDNSKIISKLVSVYNSIIFFFETCCEFSLELDSEMKSVVCRFLVELLGHPLSLYNTGKIGQHPNELLVIATQITEKVFKFLDDPIKQVDKQFDFDSCTTAYPISVGHLLYLVYVKGVCYNLMPKVYQHTYLLKKCVILFNALLKEDDFIIGKALSLCKTLMLPVKPGCISYLVLDDPEQCNFFILLTNIIIYNDQELLRKNALNVLKMYLTLLDSRGVYQVTISLFNIVTHSGLRGFLITYSKERINEGVLNQNLSLYFQGTKLLTLLKYYFCKLDRGEQTDLVQNLNQITAALNLLRFLAIIECSKAKIGLRQCESVLMGQFMDPLRRALELSRAHYNLEIKTVQDAIVNKTPTPGGMSPEEKLPLLSSSITAFDLMESLLCRVVELIDHKLD